MAASEEDEPLSRKQQTAVVELLTAASLRAVAAKVGVSEKTLRNWLKLPNFQKACQEARKLVMERAVNGLQRGLVKANKALLRNMVCGNPSAEVKAALGLIGMAFRGTEVVYLTEEMENIKEILKAKGMR